MVRSVVIIFLLAISIVSVAGRAYADDTVLPLASLPAIESVEQPAALPEAGYPVWSQADPEWATARLGTRTVREIGCLLTALAAVGYRAGMPLNPLELSRLVIENRALRGNRILWGTLFSRILTNLRQVARVTLTQGQSALETASQYFGSGRHVLLRLSRGGREHWVLATRALSGDLEVMDPDGGRLASFSALYGARTNVHVTAILVLEEV